jgi:soluble lytic murein transglycosylase-like protein
MTLEKLLWRCVPVVAVAAISLLASPADGQYLAVFVDGRVLPVSGAQLAGRERMRLDLRNGAFIEVPLARLDRVIKDEVEVRATPISKPSCVATFSAHALPAGTPFASEITAASRSFDLHPKLVAAVVKVESNFKPYAVSRVGAGGLMQLMPSVWLAQRVTNPYDPKTNLHLGCEHLRKLLDRFGDLELALAAYNAGVATVERSGGMPPYRETREFVRRVLARFCPVAERGGG